MSLQSRESVSSSGSGTSEISPLYGSSTGYPSVSVDSSLAYNSTYEERLSLLRNEPAVRVISPEVNVQPAGSSWFASVFIVVNAALGAGLLNFPQAFDQSGGIVVAITTQAVLMVFIIGAIVILAYCSDMHQNATYQDVVYSMCGKNAQLACSVLIAVYSFGCCITFFIIMGDQWDKFLTFAYGPDFCHYWYMNRRFTLPINAVLLVLPLCYPRRIDFLKYASTAGVIGVLYCVILVTYKYFQGSITPGPIKTKPDTWEDVFTVVPVICFAYQCHISCVPVYACLKKRTVGEFIKTVLVALGVCIFAYTGTAAFGYLTFGSDVKADILTSYDPTPDVLIAVILIALKMYTTYPILLFVGRAAFECLWITLRKLPAEQIAREERLRRILVTSIWFVITLLLAILIPDISAVISVLGGLAALFIFTFPGLCLLQVLLQGFVDFQETPVRYILLMAMSIGYLIIGAFIFGVTTTQSLWNDITGPKASPSITGC